MLHHVLHYIRRDTFLSLIRSSAMKSAKSAALPLLFEAQLPSLYVTLRYWLVEYSLAASDFMICLYRFLLYANRRTVQYPSEQYYILVCRKQHSNIGLLNLCNSV